MSTMDRRTFVAGAAAATVAVMGAGSGIAVAGEEMPVSDYAAALGEGMRGMPVKDLPWPCFDECESPIGYEAREIGADEITETIEAEVVVIGGGVCGLMATLHAADLGAQVVCLEKMHSGRDQWEAVGGYNSTSQQEKGQVVDPAEYADYIIKAGGYRVRQENIWSFINNSGEAIDFMQKMLDRTDTGIVIENTTEPELPIQCEHTFLNTGAPTWLLGPYVMAALNQAVTTFDNIDMRFDTAGVQLIAEDGAITGVIAKNMETEAYFAVKASKGVILATGGYEMNPGMVKAWCRPEDYATCSMSSTGTGSTGDGHMMGLAVGAGMDPLPHCTMGFGGGYPCNGQFFHPFFQTGIFVNARGKRFVNEGLMFNFTASAINTNAYRGGVWTIVDQATMDAQEMTDDKLEDYFEEGWLLKADTLEELAGLMGVDAANLADTVQTWNGFVDEGEDKQYKRAMDTARKYETAPFYAMKTNTSFLVTVSGLTIDPDCRVLDKNEQPIPGLFAGGNASGGMFADLYPRHLPATSVGRCVTNGFVAARTACTE